MKGSKMICLRWCGLLLVGIGCANLIQCGLILAAPQALGAERTDQWNGFVRHHFDVGNQAAYVVTPIRPAAGKPWVWRARFPDYHPEIDIELLRLGYHVGYVDVAGMFGNAQAMEIGDAFYSDVLRRRGLSRKVTLEGVSRGGLFVYQWAARNPNKVANILCDTPVCDMRSWPGGEGAGVGAKREWTQCLNAYQLSEEEAMSEGIASMVRHVPVIVAAGIPVMHVVTEDDRIVPPSENTYVMSERFAELGHPIKVISIEHGTAKSNGHHFQHKDIKPMVEFVSAERCDSTTLEMFQSAQRIVFLGDSITYAGEYVARLEAMLRSGGIADPEIVINVGLPSETVSGLSEAGHAGGRFPRPDLAERLERVLDATRPDLVVACYGINCGIYQPFDPSRFEKYQNGIQRLKTAVESVGAQLLLITPPTFDDQRAKKSFSYDQVMQRYSNWLLSKRDDGWAVLDLHGAMVKELEVRRKDDPDFTFQPDAVHPNTEGQQWIANAIMKALVGSAEITPSQGVQLRTIDEPLLDLVRQRSHLWRDAYLTKAGHTRPGIRKGWSLEEAQQKSEAITGQVDALLGRRE